MHPAAETAAEQHLGDLIKQLQQTRQRHGITRHTLDRHLNQPHGTTRERELRLTHRALPLTQFAAWSRALDLIPHLTDKYGRVLPTWMPEQPPHQTKPAFEAQRLVRILDLRLDTTPANLRVLADHLGITDNTWQDWTHATTCPDLLTTARACTALDTRITLTPLWHQDTLTHLHTLQTHPQHTPPHTRPNPNNNHPPRHRPRPTRQQPPRRCSGAAGFVGGRR